MTPSVRGEVREARVLQPAVLDAVGRGLGEAAVGVDRRVARRELGPAAQARAEALGLGGRRAREEAAVALERRPRRAHRAAVDAGRAHAHEEASVEAGVVGAQGAVALVGVEEHGAHYPPRRAGALAVFGHGIPPAIMADGPPQRIRGARRRDDARLRPVEANAMFGGWGLYHQGAFFAIVAGDTLYLKTDAQNRARFEAQGLEPFVFQAKDGKKTAMSYRRAPDEALERPRGDGRVGALRVRVGAAGRGRQGQARYASTISGAFSTGKLTEFATKQCSCALACMARASSRSVPFATVTFGRSMPEQDLHLARGRDPCRARRVAWSS